MVATKVQPDGSTTTDAAIPSGFSEMPVEKMAYDRDRDGVWIGDDLFLPRNTIIKAIGCLPGSPPDTKKEGK